MDTVIEKDKLNIHSDVRKAKEYNAANWLLETPASKKRHIWLKAAYGDLAFTKYGIQLATSYTIDKKHWKYFWA